MIGDDVAFGTTSGELVLLQHFRFTPKPDIRANIVGRRFGP